MTQSTGKKSSPISGRRMALVLALLALLLLTVVVVIIRTGRHEKIEVPPPVKVDTIPQKPPDTAAPKPVFVKPRIRKPPVVADTVRPQPADTVKKDTVKTEPDAAFLEKGAESDCVKDTAPLWVYPEPSGGLHYGAALVRFRSNRQCTVSWYLTPDSTYRFWSGDTITVDRNATLVYMAVDKCGYVMQQRRETYQVERAAVSDRCPKDMDQVSIGGVRFCVDRYEWPNRRGTVPSSYVSLYQAADSCFSVKKRLCTSEEWSLACGGPYSFGFPYGQDYEPRACVTSDTTARPSGSRPECRAYFGSFDMSGNLSEWTSTPARENRSYNNVMGGFWESGPRSGCFDVRYSYFPQNRHNPVGFRCCRDLKGGK